MRKAICTLIAAVVLCLGAIGFAPSADASRLCVRAVMVDPLQDVKVCVPTR